MKLMRWGLIPGWAKDESIGDKLINARAETVSEKTSFKKLLNSSGVWWLPMDFTNGSCQDVAGRRFGS